METLPPSRVTPNNAEMSVRTPARWEDEAEIRNLAHDYADAVLVKDAPRLRSLWVQDRPRAPYPDLDVHWARRVSRIWSSWGPTLLHVTTHAIAFDGPDEAHGRVQCIVQMDRPEGFVDQSVVYEDAYVRERGRWLFVARQHRLWFGWVRAQHPMDQAASEWPRSQVGSGSLPEDLGRLWAESASAETAPTD
jgi:hypothetical protein